MATGLPAAWAALGKTLGRADMFQKAVSCDLLWDAAAFEAVDESQRWILTVMRRHGHELVTMLWRILGNEQDVCDAYQTTFLRLAHHEEGLKPRWVKAYLFRTASNTAVSMLRQRVAERRALSSTAPAAAGAADPQSLPRHRDGRGAGSHRPACAP